MIYRLIKSAEAKRVPFPVDRGNLGDQTLLQSRREAVKSLHDPKLRELPVEIKKKAALEKSKVKGASGKRILTDLASLVRFAIHQDNELVPFSERVNANFRAWLAKQESTGKKLTEEQRRWSEMIRDHIAASLSVEPNDFESAPFAQQGGLGKASRMLGDKLAPLLDELGKVLAARPRPRTNYQRILF